MALEPGQVIDQYRLDQTIHRGHATIVYAATDLGLGRKVAFKVLTDRYSKDPSIRQRFVTEAQIAASLDGHPHIVTVYKWGQFEDSMYFVTELIDGISLAELLERQPGGQPLPPAEVLSLFEQIAGAIDFAHKRGAIHRDVKPANIMVKMTETPRSAYLVDFGITKMGEGDHTSPVGMFLGTPDYASPEQISGAQALDRRADVYSLACTAFHALTGRPPYGGAPNDAARIAAHLQAPVPSARALRPELPEGIDAVFAKALAKNRDDRYASCSEFVRDLRAAFPTAAHEFKRALPPGAEMQPPSLYGPEDPPRRKWPFVVIAIVLVALLTTAAFFLTEGRRNPTLEGELAADVSTSTTTTTTTTTTTSTTTTTTTSTIPESTTIAPVANALGYLPGAEITSATNAPEEYVIGLQTGSVSDTLAPFNSPARLYAEWVWALNPAEPGPVIAGPNGYVIQVDIPLEISEIQIDAASGAVTGFAECQGEQFASCAPLASRVIVRTDDCEPAAGCPTTETATGDVRAYQRATVMSRSPAASLIYELVTERVITSIAEPTGVISFTPGSNYFVATYASPPVERTFQLLTLTYDDGTFGNITIGFEGEVTVPATDAPISATTTTLA